MDVNVKTVSVKTANVIIVNHVKNYHAVKMDKYIFITTGNQSGSSILQNLFASCEDIIHLDKKPEGDSYTIFEGSDLAQDSLPVCMNDSVSDMAYVWTEGISEIEKSESYNWEGIKKAWHSHWKKRSAYKNDIRIFLEKSPENVGRVKALSENFDNAWFMCQVRNPYAVAEGVRRRMTSSKCNIRRAATHALKMLELQKENLKYDNVLMWRYEDLWYKQNCIEQMIKDCLNIIDFSIQRVVPANSVDGYIERHVVTDLNEKQIASLTEKDFHIINEVFDTRPDLMNFFNYERLTWQTGK